MSKTLDILGVVFFPLLAIAGVLVLFVLPIARLAFLVAELGLAPLAVFYVVEGVVVLVRSLSPWRASPWFKSKDAETPGVVIRAMGMDLMVSAGAALLLLVTRGLWQPLVHVDVPAWLVAFIALRAAGTSVLVSLCMLRRRLALVLVLVDLAAVLPIAAFVYGTLEGAVVVSAFITWMFVLAIAWMPAAAKLPSEGGIL